MAVRAQDDEVVEHGVLEHDLVPDAVGPLRLALGHAEADREGIPLRGVGVALLRRQLEEARAVVPGRMALRERLLTPALQLLGIAEAAIRVALGEELLRPLRVDREPLALPVGSMRPARVRALVPVEAEPPERLVDRALRLLGGALAVGVLDPEHEHAPVAPGIQVVEEGGAGSANMEISGRARREPDPYGGRHPCSFRG